MTICAAVICQHMGEPVIIGIADKRYTKPIGQGYSEYDSRASKLYRFSRNVVSWSADDGDIALDIAYRTSASLAGRLAEPNVALPVFDVADEYRRNHVVLRNRKVTSRLLAHLNLDVDSFAAGRHGLPPNLVAEIYEKMKQPDMNLGTQALVFGVDSTGPHIYGVCDPGETWFGERSGYQAIGMGAEHFETVFMAASYDSGKSLMDALLLAVSAKRQAEMASGVGETTDIVIVRETGNRILTTDQLRIVARVQATLAQDADCLRSLALGTLINELPELP